LFVLHYDCGLSTYDLERLTTRQALIFVDKVNARKVEEIEKEYHDARRELTIHAIATQGGKAVKDLDKDLEKASYSMREPVENAVYKPDKKALEFARKAKAKKREV